MSTADKIIEEERRRLEQLLKNLPELMIPTTLGDIPKTPDKVIFLHPKFELPQIEDKDKGCGTATFARHCFNFRAQKLKFDLKQSVHPEEDRALIDQFILDVNQTLVVIKLLNYEEIILEPFQLEPITP